MFKPQDYFAKEQNAIPHIDFDSILSTIEAADISNPSTVEMLETLSRDLQQVIEHYEISGKEDYRNSNKPLSDSLSGDNAEKLFNKTKLYFAFGIASTVATAALALSTKSNPLLQHYMMALTAIDAIITACVTRGLIIARETKTIISQNKFDKKKNKKLATELVANLEQVRNLLDAIRSKLSETSTPNSLGNPQPPLRLEQTFFIPGVSGIRTVAL